MEKESLPQQLSYPQQLSFSFQQPSPFCHPERTWVSYITALNGATYVVLLKENHMQLTEAATLDMKSGEAEGSAVRHSGAPNLPFYDSKLPRQSRHPERSASPICRKQRTLWRGVEGPRRCLLADALGSFPAANYNGR
jgi:hypothetical protein